MSASNQKKLRKEQKLAYMSERQRIEAEEKKKLKIYTATFWIILALCVCIVVGTVVSNPIKNVVYTNTDAVTVGNHTLNAVTVNYFYIDAVNTYVNQYSSYISYILNVSKPLNEQIADKTTNATWADTFLDSAFENMKSTYALYDLAMEKNHKLTEDEQKSVDSMFTNLALYATIYGYQDTDSYLRAVYGNGATEESYRAYYEVSAMADSYYTAYSDSLEYEDADLRAYEKDKMHEYNSYTYSTYYLGASTFYTGGTVSEDGKTTTYTDEEKEAGRQIAEDLAEKLSKGEYKDIEEFNNAIKELHEKTKSGKATEYDDVLYSSINSLFRDWIIGKVEKEDTKDEKTSDDEKEDEVTYVARKEGEMTVIEYASGSGDSKVVNGYYVVRYESVENNQFNLRNVRHILVQFEGGKTNSSTGETTYTDAEKKAAKAAAELLLDRWKNGDKTEDSFAELAKKESDDTGSKDEGGLYEEIYPGQMVEAFEDWCFDKDRKVGDTGIVETTYGYHVMYYVGEADVTYRDFMITNTIRNEDLEKWHEELVKAIKLTELNLKYVEMDMILSAG